MGPLRRAFFIKIGSKRFPPVRPRETECASIQPPFVPEGRRTLAGGARRRSRSATPGTGRPYAFCAPEGRRTRNDHHTYSSLYFTPLFWRSSRYSSLNVFDR